QRKSVIRLYLCVISVSLCLCGYFISAANGQAFPRPRPDAGPKPKNVHGLVLDARGQPLSGALVFIRDMKSKITRTLQTDDKGQYNVTALTPVGHYEASASKKGKESEKNFFTSFLNRKDNFLNFQLDVSTADTADAKTSSDTGPSFKSFDLVELHASFDMPV